MREYFDIHTLYSANYKQPFTKNARFYIRLVHIDVQIFVQLGISISRY